MIRDELIANQNIIAAKAACEDWEEVLGLTRESKAERDTKIMLTQEDIQLDLFKKKLINFEKHNSSVNDMIDNAETPTLFLNNAILATNDYVQEDADSKKLDDKELENAIKTHQR